MESVSYSPREMMIVAASRFCRDDERVLVGVGLPILATSLAKRLHAPRLVQIFEAGIIDARLTRMPAAVGDPSIVRGCAGTVPLHQMFAMYLAGGHIDAGFLGAAQVDRYGNINTTVIGSYEAPKVRIGGSGGGSDIACLARRTIIVLPQERRNFPERVDFVTSPGYLSGGRSREEAGLRYGGPEAVVTDRAVFGFDPETREMELRSVHPGTSVEEIRATVHWPLKVADVVEVTPPPPAEALRILREELRPDPRVFKRATG